MGGEHMLETSHLQTIETKIVTIRGQQVMLDRDLAGLYKIKPYRLREKVKRNLKRFPAKNMFQLNQDDVDILVSQNAIPSKKQLGGSLPYVFTEFGCYALSAVLNTDFGIAVNQMIIEAFVNLKHHVQDNPNYALLNERIKRLETETKLFNAKADTTHAEMAALKAERKIDLNVQNMEINDLSEKMTELLKEFNKFRDTHIVIKKDDGIGKG